jgi:hypothetical protein
MRRYSKQCLNLGHYAQGKKQEASPDSDEENIRFIIIETVLGVCKTMLSAVATVVKGGGFRAECTCFFERSSLISMCQFSAR